MCISYEGRDHVNRALFVREHGHEVGQAGDLEDFNVVFAQSAGKKAAMGLSGSGEEAHDKSDAGAVYVVHLTEVEHYGVRAFRLSVGISGVEHLFGKAVDLPFKV